MSVGSEMVLVKNGVEEIISTESSLINVDVEPDSKLTWSVRIDDVNGVHGRSWEGSTLYMCPGMMFHANMSDITKDVVINTKDKTKITIVWNVVEWDDPVCSEAAQSLNVMKYIARITEPTGASVELSTTSNQITYMVSPGMYTVELMAEIDGTRLTHKELWFIVVKYEMASSKIVGIAAGCGAAGVLIIAMIVIVVIVVMKK